MAGRAAPCIRLIVARELRQTAHVANPVRRYAESAWEGRPARVSPRCIRANYGLAFSGELPEELRLPDSGLADDLAAPRAPSKII